MDKSKHKLKLFLLYWTGYGYFILLVLGILVLFGLGLFLMKYQARLGIRVIRRLVPLIVIVVALMRGFFNAMFTKIPAPEGIELKRAEVPEFFELLEEIRAKVNCPKIHSVKFDLSFNAYVAEIPQFGVFGLYRRYIVIGIPLMLVLSKEELTAVIGHELGHLSKAHGKMSVKILRAANVWTKTAEELRKYGKDKSSLIKPFLVRYIPALNNALFSLRRENEYAADQVAVSVTNPTTTASILVKLPIYDLFLENVFWHRINVLPKTVENPPIKLFHEMETLCETPLLVEQSKQVLSQILQIRSLPCWTHPSVAERLENIGVKPELPKHTKVNSLEAIFKAKADLILQKANALWVSNVSESWRERYKSIDESRQRLNQLEEKKNRDGVLTYDEEIVRGLLLEELEGAERGLEAFQALHAAKPDDLPVAYHLGRLMIELENLEGQEILKEVMEHDPQLIPHCCNVLYRYYVRKGEIDQASQHYYYAVKFMETNEDVKEERNSVRFSQTYIPHDLAMHTIEELRSKLIRSGYVERAYVAIKRVEKSGQFPLYIILVKLKSTVRSERKEMIQELANSDLIPWECFVIPLHGKNRELEYRLTSLPDSRII